MGLYGWAAPDSLEIPNSDALSVCLLWVLEARHASRSISFLVWKAGHSGSLLSQFCGGAFAVEHVWASGE